MNFELPADARIQIFIGSAGAFALPDSVAPMPVPLPPAQAPASPKRLVLKSTVAALLLGGAYILGGASARHEGSMQARAQTSPPVSSAAPVAASPPQGPTQVPQAFADKLPQAPTVTPPPGAAAPAPATKNPFGLQD